MSEVLWVTSVALKSWRARLSIQPENYKLFSVLNFAHWRGKGFLLRKGSYVPVRLSQKVLKYLHRGNNSIEARAPVLSSLPQRSLPS